MDSKYQDIKLHIRDKLVKGYRQIQIANIEFYSTYIIVRGYDKNDNMIKYRIEKQKYLSIVID